MKQTFLGISARCVLIILLVILMPGCAQPNEPVATSIPAAATLPSVSTLPSASTLPPEATLSAATTLPEAQTSTEPATVVWPTNGWELSTPQEQGLDAARLDEMLSMIDEQNVPLDGLLLVRNGKIVLERYYGSYDADTQHIMYSVTKSFVSTLVGIAVDQGKLEGVELRALDLLPGGTFENMDPRKESMTLENLLTMTSGLDFEEGDPTYRKMYNSDDWVKMVMDLPMATDPGKEFLYCSGCSHVLSAIVQEAAGESTLDFARKNLFEPLGITNVRWEADRQGIPIGGWGLNVTPRDMAKLGYLYLHNGKWEEKQILSESWVKAATTRHIGTGGNLGYGYQWWIYPSHNAYVALGRSGQTIFVAPDLNLIFVVTAHDENGHGKIYKLIDDYVIPAAE